MPRGYNGGMEFGQWMQIITAAIAGLAIVVGPLVSLYVARRQIRASVVSNSRQQWINNLRDSLSEFLAKQMMARGLTAKDNADDSPLPRLERIEEVTRLAFKIQLLLSQGEKDQDELEDLVFAMLNTLNQQKDENRKFDAQACMDRINLVARSVIKAEWKRVASGE